MNIKKKDVVDISIHDLGSSGEGIGSYEGFTIFVEGALPSEIVKVEISVLKKNYAKGTLLQIIKESPNRVKPICPLFEQCGGCQIMHLSYKEQLESKRKKISDALQRIGHLDNVHVLPCTPSPQEFNYRNKIQLPITTINDKLTLGFYKKNSHHVVPVSNCYIHCETGQKVYDQLVPLLQNSSLQPFDPITSKGTLRNLIIKSAVNSNEVLVSFVSTSKETDELQKIANELMQICPEVKSVFLNINKTISNTILGNKWILLAGNEQITEEILGLQFKISPASFFQVNTPQAENLYKKAIELAEIHDSSTVLDAYCGVGTLSLIAAKKAKKVIGIECVQEAIDNAIENSLINDLSNTKFLCGKSEDVISTLEPIDIAMINPPRKGCEKQVIDALCKLKPATIVYISCDPATLARDLSLLNAGGYTINEVQPFDMFPQTMHVETVVKLSFKENNEDDS